MCLVGWFWWVGSRPSLFRSCLVWGLCGLGWFQKGIFHQYSGWTDHPKTTGPIEPTSLPLAHVSCTRLSWAVTLSSLSAFPHRTFTIGKKKKRRRRTQSSGQRRRSEAAASARPGVADSACRSKRRQLASSVRPPSSIPLGYCSNKRKKNQRLPPVASFPPLYSTAHPRPRILSEKGKKTLALETLDLAEFVSWDDFPLLLKGLGEAVNSQ